MYIIIKDKAGNKTHADYCKWMSKQKEGGGGGGGGHRNLSWPLLYHTS